MTNPFGRALGGLAAVAVTSVTLTGCTGDALLDQVISIIESIGIDVPVDEAGNLDPTVPAVPADPAATPTDGGVPAVGDPVAGSGDAVPAEEPGTGDDAGAGGDGFVAPEVDDDVKPDVPPASTEGPVDHDHQIDH